MWEVKLENVNRRKKLLKVISFTLETLAKEVVIVFRWVFRTQSSITFFRK